MENQEVNIQESRWLVFLKESLLVLVLGLAIWLPRGYSLEKFVSTDEIPWLVRSANFYFALGQRDFNATFQNGTPGVTTMWVNTIAFIIENPEYRGFGQGYFDSFLTFERFADSQGIDSHAILITARSIMVVIHTLLLIFCYFLARKLLGFLPALAGILLIIFEPYFIGLTRLSHLDGLVGTLSLVGVLSFIIYAFKDQKFRYLFAASIATSAASLTKVSGFIILPGLGLILFLMFFFHYREFQNKSRQKFVGWIRKITIHMLLFSGIFLLFYFLIWPAMWNDPIGTIIEQFQYPGRFLPETSQVNNEQSDKYLVPYVDENNQIFRYPENFLWRVTPISIFGLVFWIYFVLKHFDFFSSRKNRYISFSLLAFAINFTLLLTIPVKSNFRYWIPAYLSLLMLAGIGWSTFYRFIQDKVHERHWKRIIFLVILGIIITHLFAVFNTYPYYFTYYNPLYGGSKRAGNTISIGEGEGLDQAGLYLSSLPHAEDLTVMSWYGWGSFSYYFSGKTITFPVTSSWSTGLANKLRSSDYLVVYQNQWYRRIPAEMFDSLDQVEPIKTIWVDGLEYARIYEVDNLPDQIFNP